MQNNCTLRTLLRLALIKWRFRNEPKLVKIYMGRKYNYLPACCNIKDVELDVSSSTYVESIGVLLRTYDIWFIVKERSGKVKIFNHQLSPGRTNQAQNLDLAVNIETLVSNLSLWKAEKLFRCRWIELLREIVKDYQHDLK